MLVFHPHGEPPQANRFKPCLANMINCAEFSADRSRGFRSAGDCKSHVPLESEYVALSANALGRDI
jgi:hypothetical protein